MTFSYPKLKLVFPTLIVMRPPSITSLSVSPVLGWGWASPIFVHGQILEKASLLLVNFAFLCFIVLLKQNPFPTEPFHPSGYSSTLPPPSSSIPPYSFLICYPCCCHHWLVYFRMPLPGKSQYYSTHPPVRSPSPPCPPSPHQPLRQGDQHRLRPRQVGYYHFPPPPLLKIRF